VLTVRPTVEKPGPGTGGESGLDVRPPGLRKMGGAYQAALEAVFAIPVAAVLGYFADKGFGTSPIFLLVGVAMGFAAFVLRLVRLGRSIAPPQDDQSGDPADRSKGRGNS
jgi:F0F1-type ATP synthase assembly protein I